MGSTEESTMVESMAELFEACKVTESSADNSEASSSCSSLDTSQLLNALKYAGIEPESSRLIDEYSEDHGKCWKILLETALECYEAEKKQLIKKEIFGTDPSEESLKRGKIALRCLCNFSNRSEKFRGSIGADCVDLIRALLRVVKYRKEAYAVLAATVKSGYYKTFFLHDHYNNLIEDVVLSFHDESTAEDCLSFAFAFFSHVLELDYSFVSNSFADQSPFVFNQLLQIIVPLLDHGTDLKFKTHANNIEACVDALHVLVYDCESYYEKRLAIECAKWKDWKENRTVTILHLVDIIGTAAIHHEQYPLLHSKSRAIEVAIDLLEVLLHAESEYEEYCGPEEQKLSTSSKRDQIEEPKSTDQNLLEMGNTEKRYEGRPVVPPLPRNARVEADDVLRQLADHFLEDYKFHSDGPVRNLKVALLKCIGNLCCGSELNQKASASNDRNGLIAVLQCTRRRPERFPENPLTAQWAITAVRHMTVGCIENREIILNIEQSAQPIINRERLLKELGITVEKGEDGILKLKRPEANRI